MSKPKMTPWFNGKVKPARVGVYERKVTDITNPYSYWDGKSWLVSGVTVKHAADEAKFMEPSIHQKDPWRGLASDPKGKK